MTDKTVSGPLLDEGLLHILRAGGCQCDPPGSGQEFCTSHCVLRAEVRRLRALVYVHITEHHCLVCGSERGDAQRAIAIQIEDECDADD